MSKHDSVKSADTKFRINTHDYFVPAIVMVVLCILFVATFHEKNTSDHADGVADITQAEKPAVKKTAVTTIHANSPEVADASIKTMPVTTISEPSIPRDQDVTTQTSVSADTADADLNSPAQNSLTAGIDGTVTKPAMHTTSTGKPAADQNAPDRDPANKESVRQAPAADRRQAAIPMQDQRRRLYQDARQAHQAHRMKMLEYRAVVEKRIEQDRRDLYRYRHNSSLQRSEDRNRHRDRLEQARNRAEDIPI